MISQWTGLCECSNPIYNGNEKCSSCMAEEVKRGLREQHQRIKQEKALAKQKERNSKPKTAIKQQSKENKSEQAELSRIKREMVAEHPYCFTTGEYVTVHTCDLSHIIPRGNKKHVLDRKNVVLEKREPHHLWEKDKLTYSVMFPDKWRLKLMRAYEVDTSESKTEFHKLAAKAE